MKQLSGYVLARKTNVGIPNLLVAAFDSRDVASLDAAVAEERRPGAALMQRLGRRLGSVLTDDQGRFAIDREDLEFQGNEARPNLILAVFAPEDVRSADNPVPAPPEDRLLFLSQVARADAGAEEAFVIRLLQDQLDHFGIGTGAARPADGAGASLGDSIESAWDVPVYLRDRFQGRIKAQLDAVSQRQARAKKATQNLSGVPLHLRDSGRAPNFFQNNVLLLKDRSELVTKLADTQVQAVAEGLAKLGKRKTPPVVRVWMTSAELQENGLKVDDKGQLTGNLDSAKLASLVRTRMSGTDLIKKRGLANPSPEELRRRYLSPPPAPLSKSQSQLAPAGVKSKPVRSAKVPPAKAANNAKATTARARSRNA